MQIEPILDITSAKNSYHCYANVQLIRTNLWRSRLPWWPKIFQIFAEFEAVTGKDIEESIKKEFSGSVEKGMLAIGK